MKTIHRVCLTVFAIAGFSSSQFVQAAFYFGDAENYAVLYEGAGGHNLQINSSPFNGSTVYGNIGLGDELSGAPTLMINNPAVVNGDVNFAGTVHNSSNGILNGTISGGVASVESDLDTLNTLSSTLGGMSGTPISISIGNGGSQTINANGGTPVASGTYAGTYVYNVSALSFVNGATLTINGSASDFVVFNFHINTHFSGTINLTGGITPDQVLFNITGGMNLTGGDTLQFAANNVTQHGTFLDPNGNMQINSDNLIGHLYGGDSSDMQIQSGGTVAIPPVPEPSSAAVATLGLFLTFAVSRRVKKTGSFR